MKSMIAAIVCSIIISLLAFGACEKQDERPGRRQTPDSSPTTTSPMNPAPGNPPVPAGG